MSSGCAPSQEVVAASAATAVRPYPRLQAFAAIGLLVYVGERPKPLSLHLRRYGRLDCRARAGERKERANTKGKKHRSNIHTTKPEGCAPKPTAVVLRAHEEKKRFAYIIVYRIHQLSLHRQITAGEKYDTTEIVTNCIPVVSARIIPASYSPRGNLVPERMPPPRQPSTAPTQPCDRCC